MNAYLDRYLVGTIVALCGVSSASGQVRVTLDLDVNVPGIQSERAIQPGDSTVPNIGVYIIADTPTPPLIVGIGFIGGIDRGIALGHQPEAGVVGKITAMKGEVIVPVTPGGQGSLFPDFAHMFDGPAVHYLESATKPGPIPTQLGKPVFMAAVQIENAQPGESFDLFVLDAVAANFGKGGAFSSSSFNQLNSGGDAAPDGTRTAIGLDPDQPAPIPPAAFKVDYIDGQGGSRLIVVDACYADCDSSGTLNIDDFICFQTLFALGDPYADCDASGGLNIDDFVCFQTLFAIGC